MPHIRQYKEPALITIEFQFEKSLLSSLGCTFARNKNKNIDENPFKGKI